MRPSLLLLRLVLATGLLSGCASVPPAPQPGLQEPQAPGAADDGAFRFVVIADTPYSEADAAILAQAVPRIRELAPDVIIHLGDTKSGGVACTGAEDDGLATLMAALAPAPVFYTPGDNEWTDCDRFEDPATSQPMSELGRLAALRARFFASAPAHSERMGWRNQPGAPENATWQAGGIRFATVHAVGTNNGFAFVTGDPLDTATAQANARTAAAGAWVEEAARIARAERAGALVIAMQADPTDVRPAVTQACSQATTGANPCDAFIGLRAALRAAAASFGGPVLLMHGDTAPFTLNQQMPEGPTPGLWRLNATGDTFTTPTGERGGVRDVTVVTVTPGAPAPFSARALLSGAAAGQ